MDETTAQLEEISEGMKKFKEEVVTGESLARLMKNKDFKKIILDFFLADRVDELLRQKCDPDRQHEMEQAYIDKGIVACGYLAQFFEEVKLMSAKAKTSLESYEATRNDILEEGEV